MNRKTDRLPRADASPRPGQSAFTLTELLFVMLVIAILVGITLPIARYVVARAREAREKTEKEKIVNALEEYRAKFGEYPIVGDSRHYSTDLITDTNSYSPFTYVDLTARVHPDGQGGETDLGDPGRGVEYLGFASKLYIVYRLTYPLMLAPLARGESPFVNFPKITVTYLVYKRKPQTADEAYHEKRLFKTRTGSIWSPEYWTLQGNPIDRYKAMAPTTGKQWWYECSNGATYILTNRNPWGQ